MPGIVEYLAREGRQTSDDQAVESRKEMVQSWKYPELPACQAHHGIKIPTQYPKQSGPSASKPSHASGSALGHTLKIILLCERVDTRGTEAASYSNYSRFNIEGETCGWPWNQQHPFLSGDLGHLNPVL